jgi:hypothetical protein
VTQRTRSLLRPSRSPAAQLARDVRALRRALGNRRRLRLTIRALWIALAIFAVGLATRLFGLNAPWWIIVAPAAAAALILIVRSWFTDPSLGRLLHEYDQFFHTHELLATGLEVARTSDRDDRPLNEVEERLVHQTLRAVAALRRRVGSSALMPWREMEMLLGVALLALGLFVVGRNGTDPAANALAIPSLPTAAVPEEAPPADQPVAATPPPADAPATPEDQAAADAIADALSGNSATSEAGDALGAGQTGQAADALRDAAGQADQLSPESREALADDLQGAADQLQGSQPERAQALRDQASQIERDGAGAQQGLEDLADLVDELGGEGDAAAQAEGDAQAPPAGAQGGEGQGQEEGEQSGEGNGGGAGAGDGLGGESRGTQTNPSPAQGEITPLPPDPEADGPRTSATGPQGPNVELEAGGTRASDAPAGALEGGADAPLSGDADPLRIPPEYRDVVENYFSPSS